jgi:hypothetical protein
LEWCKQSVIVVGFSLNYVMPCCVADAVWLCSWYTLNCTVLFYFVLLLLFFCSCVYFVCSWYTFKCTVLFYVVVLLLFFVLVCILFVLDSHLTLQCYFMLLCYFCFLFLFVFCWFLIYTKLYCVALFCFIFVYYY